MILRVFIALVFIVAGTLKLREPQSFADGIAAFRVISDLFITPLALGIPFFEILLGLGILFRPARRAGLLAACLLCTGFVILYVSAAARGLEVHCACFGSWEFLRATTKTGLARAAILLAACLWAYAREVREAEKNQSARFLTL